MQVLLAYWPWFSLEEQLALAVEADRSGLDGVWIAEAWGQDAVSVLALVADRTERIHVGSGLFQIPARPPTAAAMAAATLDVISGGRFRMGLGVSGPQVSEGWYGVPFARPLVRTREYVEIVRMALSRQPVEHRGREWQLPIEGGTGLGKPLRLLIEPRQERIPIYLGAMGPKAIEQAGEIADGWIPAFFNAGDCEELWTRVEAGLERGGRERSEIDVAPALALAVEPTAQAARDAVRPWVAFYIGAMGAKDRNFYVDLCERHGFGDEARGVQDLFLRGQRADAEAGLPDELIDLTAIACTPDELPGRVDAFRRAGVDSLIAVPFGSDRAATVRLLGQIQG